MRRFLGYCIRRSYLRFYSPAMRVISEHGLRIPSFSALRVIADNPGVRQSELAPAIGMEPPNLVQFIDQLVTDGLVERRPAPWDGRVRLLHATRLGCEVADLVAQELNASENRLLDHLDADELSTLHRLLAKVEHGR